MRTRVVLAALHASLLGMLSAPAPAAACWDGYAASAGNVGIALAWSESGTLPRAPARFDWDPQLVRQVASGLVRVGALLPPGVSVDVGPWGDGTVCIGRGTDGHCARELGSFDWDGDVASLFRDVADILHPSPRRRARARGLPVTAWTVQVFAARDPARAESVAARLNERQKRGDDFSCDEGFISIGGFPSWNDCAHVVEARGEGGRRLDRVLVGAFLDRARARVALASIERYTSLRGFVRAI